MNIKGSVAEYLPYVWVCTPVCAYEYLHKNVIIDVFMMIYPNISKELKHENTVRLLEGNVVVKIDSRSGRLTASINNIIFCEKIHEEGMNVALVIPNSTDITQVMDNILQYFNTAFNQCTPQLCSKKIIIKSQKL